MPERFNFPITRGLPVMLVLLCCFAISGTEAFAASSEPQAWMKAPVVPVLSGKLGDRLVRDVARARKHNLRPAVFAKVGDSNTEMAPVLYGLACETPTYGRYGYLRPTVARYNRVKLPNARPLAGCEPSTSFSRHSAAAISKTWSTWSINPESRFIDPAFIPYPPECENEVLALVCELKLTRPRYTLVMTGTNDLALDAAVGLVPGANTGNRLGQVVRKIRAFGSIPLVGYLPPILGSSPESATKLERGVKRSNRGIWKMAKELRVPVINFWRALRAPGMINQGLDADGLHLSRFESGGEGPQPDPGPSVYADSVNFSREALRYGANRRNLIVLQTLARLDRAVARAEAQALHYDQRL